MAWRAGLFDERGAEPGDPLAAITPSSITAVELVEPDRANPLDVAQVRAAARVIASLHSEPRLSGHAINWVGARMLRARLANGVLLSLQVVRSDQGGYVRITADPPPGASPATRAKADELRALRTTAYRLDAEAVKVLFP